MTLTAAEFIVIPLKMSFPKLLVNDFRVRYSIHRWLDANERIFSILSNENTQLLPLMCQMYEYRTTISYAFVVVVTETLCYCIWSLKLLTIRLIKSKARHQLKLRMVIAKTDIHFQSHKFIYKSYSTRKTSIEIASKSISFDLIHQLSFDWITKQQRRSKVDWEQCCGCVEGKRTISTSVCFSLFRICSDCLHIKWVKWVTFKRLTCVCELYFENGKIAEMKNKTRARRNRNTERSKVNWMIVRREGWRIKRRRRRGKKRSHKQIAER